PAPPAASKPGMGTPTRLRPPDSDHGRADEFPSVLPADEPDDDVPSVLPAERGERLPWALPAPRPSLVRCVLGAIGSAWEWLFGAVTLIVGLAVLAAMPLVGLLSLGYLLEAGGRIGRTGRLRDGFIGVPTAARAGGIVVGTWLMLLPLRLV